MKPMIRPTAVRDWSSVESLDDEEQSEWKTYSRRAWHPFSLVMYVSSTAEMHGERQESEEHVHLSKVEGPCPRTPPCVDAGIGGIVDTA